MTVSKLSQIASSPANAVSADTFVGVHGGNTDYQFSLPQIAGGLNSSGLLALQPATSNLTFYVATTGSDSNDGSAAHPFATIQHAVSVALGFDYQALYTVTISCSNGTYTEQIVVNGPLFGKSAALNPTITIVGNATSPGSCTIQSPSLNNGLNIVDFKNCLGQLDGFTISVDPTEVNLTANMVNIDTGSIVELGTLVFALGNGSASYNAAIEVSNRSRSRANVGAGSQSITFTGTTSFNFNYLINPNRWSEFDGPNSTIFSSALDFNGNVVFRIARDSTALLGSAAFVTPGNITNGIAIQLAQESFLDNGGVDPATITWPGGAFDPTQIDGASSIDGFYYGQQNAGQLVDESTIYRGSWRIFKDTTNVRRYLAFDDGGTIYAKQIGRVPNTQTVNYTLALSDQDGLVEMNLAGANTLTVPTNASVAFPIGTEILVSQMGAGATTIAGAGGVTVDNAGVVGAQWQSVKLYKRGTDEWVQTAVQPVGANPTATAGPSAVNGSAATFMRSDGAPAVQLGTNAQKGIVQVDGNTVTASSGIISVPLGVPKATSFNWSVNNGYQLNIENRVTLTSTQEATLVGNANLIVTDDNTPILVGSPKSNASFTLPTDRFLEVLGELVLNGSQRSTLQGNSNLVLKDDFGTRSRIVLH